MERVGFLGRIMLILMVALVALIALTIGINNLSHPGFRRLSQSYPRIAHAAGIIAIMRSADEQRRREIMHATSDRGFRVEILDEPPRASEDDVRAPRAEARMREMVGSSLEGLKVFTNVAYVPAHLGKMDIEGRLTRVEVPIDEGRQLVIEWLVSPKLASLTFFGLPPSVWAGILGFGVALLALASVFREVRPLRQLTASVSAFDGRQLSVPFEPEGAPDIRRLTHAVYGMQERVAALLRERSFLIGAISHDLRTYLTRLRLRAESVADNDLRERMASDLDAMSRMIDISLAFARGTTSSETRSRVDLADLVAVEVEEQKALGSPIALEATYDDNAIVLGDPVALRRVVSNLLDNALRFARQTVRVRVDRGPARERIVVEDDGPGIPDEMHGAVFEPFYRTEPSTGVSTGGTGLGLAIARQIVEAHGGTIEIGAGRSEGAAFIVTLPSAQRRARSPAPLLASQV